MERSEVVRTIIMSIKRLKEEAKALFASDAFSRLSGSELDTAFQQQFTPLTDHIRVEIRRLPIDEYIAIELDAWIKVLAIKLNAIDSDSQGDADPNQAYVRRRFYPELINLLTDLKLEVLETEFDSRVDSAAACEMGQFGECGPNTLVVSPAVIAALVTLMYNFNLLRASASVDSICSAFSSLTGYSAESIRQHLVFDNVTGRLKSLVHCDDLLLLEKICKSMLSRLDYVISYNSERG